MSNLQQPKLHQLSGPLFKHVQESGLFTDCKTWVDTTAKASYDVILAAYQAEHASPDFDLMDFVKRYFTLPADAATHVDTKEDMFEHIDHLWDQLKREATHVDVTTETLLPLPHDYIVPGGRFREIYYWDTYFTGIGLAVSGRFDLIEHMLDNFCHLVDTYGHIPNGNRRYYLSRSQPPVLGCFIKLYVEKFGVEASRAYIESLMREYDYWMSGAHLLFAEDPEHRRVVRMPDGSVLNRYWDDKNTPREESYREDTALYQASSDNAKPHIYRNIRAAAESGWDFSSRWCATPNDLTTIETTRLVSVDLNGWLYKTEILLADCCQALNLKHEAKQYQKAADARQKAVNKYCWNEVEQSFFDYHLDTHATTGRETLACAMPLFARMATSEQAAAIAKQLENKFLQPGGFVTTLLETPEQWDAPNGWAPLQWIAIKGLINYGHDALAQKALKRWLHTNEALYQDTGRMMEKYNVKATSVLARGGEYPSQDGFGWTNGIAVKLKSIAK